MIEIVKGLGGESRLGGFVESDVSSENFSGSRLECVTCICKFLHASLPIFSTTGAHKNAGLGHNFLRHIFRTKVLLFVVDSGGHTSYVEEKLQVHCRFSTVSLFRHHRLS